MTQDYDTPAENLTYFVQHLAGGYLSYKNFFNRKIHNFTQDDINHENIYFINDHNGQAQFGQVMINFYFKLTYKTNNFIPGCILRK